MTGLIDYLHLRFHSNNNNNNNCNDYYNHDNEDNNSIDTEYSSDNITVKIDTLRSATNPNSENNSSDDNGDGNNNFNSSDDEEEVYINSIEMAKQFHLFKIQKPILSKNDILTFRKCRLHANHIKKQVTNNDDITIFSKNDKRSKTDNIPKYDDVDILSSQRIESMKRDQSENDLKNSEYDDKWLRILKGVNRRNYTIGRKYRYIEERVWNNVSIQSLYSESPALDITAID
ncbi:hypothetical protein C6P45_003824 [Maudiozyma exigua]|uniref:Uncharacterized protein n=1 Tax=Maudiozyma exigua TaxID=34358 RepID=A0A9P6WDK1_MAUEX|nr:hypothetical protein C6P45_003824 [Kazachstania exigua]